MGEAPSRRGRLLVVGANHRSAALSLRDRLFVEPAAAPAFLARLGRAGIGQALVLSTCDRVEVQAIASEPIEARRRITEALAEHAGIALADLDGQLYALGDEAAVKHLFAVAASLDSLVVGEPQVLGQVKASHRLAREAGTCQGELEAVLQAAYAAAKRVRRETAIGERPVSIAAAAVEIAREVHGELDRARALLIGAGDMGELVARDLLAAGLGQLAVCHPAEARAEAAAGALGCHVAPFAELAGRLAEADIVLAALGARRHIVTAEMVAAALARRRQRPMFLVDAAIPGDIDPAVERLAEAFLYDLGDLERVALGGRRGREAEAAAAARIVDAEVAEFMRGRAAREAVPTLVGLRRHFEAVREEVLAEAGGDAEKATRLLVNRLLHGPSEVLREIAAAGESASPDAAWAAIERAIRRVFRLEGEAGEGAAEPPAGGASSEEKSR